MARSLEELIEAEAASAAAAEGVAATATRRPAAWRALLRSPLTLAGLVLAAVLVILAVCAPLFTPYNPIAMDLGHRLLAPSLAHPFGTDDGGRDLFSRVLYGARLSLGAAVTV